MFRHYITSINYDKLIKLQASQSSDLCKINLRKTNNVSQPKSKAMVKRMKAIKYTK